MVEVSSHIVTALNGYSAMENTESEGGALWGRKRRVFFLFTVTHHEGNGGLLDLSRSIHLEIFHVC